VPLGTLGRALLRPTLRKAQGAIGAGVGYGFTPEGEDPLFNMASGAVLGGLATPSLMRELRTAKGATNKFVRANYFSLLSGLGSLGKAHGGGFSAPIVHAMDDIAETLLTGNLEPAKRGGRVFYSLLTESLPTYRKTILAEADELKAFHKSIAGVEVGDLSFRHMGGEKGLGRFFMAPDLVGIRALTRGGMSADEAARYTLAGDPASRSGMRLLETVRGWQRSEGPERSRILQGLAAATAPFPRVALTGIEKGLERMPGVGYAANYLMKGNRLARGIAQPTLAQQTAQQAVTGLAMWKGVPLIEQYLDPRWAPVAMAATGPMHGSMWFAHMVRERMRRGEHVALAGLNAVPDTFSELNPLGVRPLSALMDPGRELGRRLVPQVVADIAAGGDPAAYGRRSDAASMERAKLHGELDPLLEFRQFPRWMQGVFDDGLGAAVPRTSATDILKDVFRSGVGQVMSRTPGLRRKLPERFMPTGFFGDPVYKTPEATPGAEDNPILRAISRSFAKSSPTLEPPPDLSNPQINALHDLGIDVGHVSESVGVPGLALSLQQTPASAAAVTRYRGEINKETARRFFQSVQGQGLLTLPESSQREIAARDYWSFLRSAVQRENPFNAMTIAAAAGARMPKSVGRFNQ
jgi:hypothetical protein